MTGIPANVQNYLGASRAPQPKIQAAESKGDFGKVLDRQKTETAKERDPKAAEQKDVSRAEDAKTPKQTEDVQTEDVQTEEVQTEDVQTEDVQTQEEPAAEQEPESVDALQQPETEAVGKTETESEPQTADDGQTAMELPVSGQPAKDQPTELSAEELEEAMEVLQSVIGQIRDLLMQQLDLTPQELGQLMQDRGFTEVSLLQPEAVNQLVLDATGAEDSLSLVMDEGLYEKQQIITQDYQEITGQLEKQPEGMGEKLSKALESLQRSAEGQPIQETYAAPESQDKSGGRGGEEKSAGHDRNATGELFYQNYTQQIQNQAVGRTDVMTAGAESTYMETQDPQQIMNQVLDYMKVSMKPENTVLEMQLHPESLGTLHVQISAREGVMTAHFTASSEAVKTVLENQMTALKESFLQQDIRVEAIEVTVETHQFESNLEQGRQSSQETADRRPKRRRLDISSLEPEEELTETEQILTDMMVANGNSVDYLA